LRDKYGKVIRKKNKTGKPLPGKIEDERSGKVLSIGYIEKPNIYDLTSIESREGYGLKRKLKISKEKGITTEPFDRFVHFGKHIIHYPKLQEGVFNLRYASGANHKKFPISNISKDYKDFMIHFIDNKSVNDKLLHLLPKVEQTHFKNLLRETGLSNQYKVKTSNESEEKQDHDRFIVLQGEINAGNNNKELVNEYKDFLNKFGQTGKLNKKQVKDALKTLSNISK
jgi:hypothetical protein